MLHDYKRLSVLSPLGTSSNPRLVLLPFCVVEVGAPIYNRCQFYFKIDKQIGPAPAIVAIKRQKYASGPKGMDKILQPLPGEGASKETTVTNDGATILSRVWVDNPSAKILVDISKSQDQECGDGTCNICWVKF